MNGQPGPQTPAGSRRIQATRRPRRRETYADTTLTDTWPPRLNTAL
jgi:hypothetical protein